MSGTVRPPSDASLASSPAIAVAHAVTSFAPSSRAPSIDLIKVCPTCGLRYPAEFKVCPRDAAELEDVDSGVEVDDMVGKTIAGSYTIVKVLGEGGMGRVYEARHTRIGGKRFAVKMLHPEFTRQPEVPGAPSSSPSSSRARSSRATWRTRRRCRSAPPCAWSARSARPSSRPTTRASSTGT
jgi:serine/threonine-protein kinase